MSASLARLVFRKSPANICCQRPASIAKRFYCSKSYERHENDLVQAGETKQDRYVGVDKVKKPHPETPPKGMYELEQPKGKIYDKKPFPMELEANKLYRWCSCGHSKTQPLCDGSHKRMADVLKRAGNPAYLPIKFRVEKTGKYWLCNCKQSNNRPYCDGTHKQEDIQKKVKS